MRFYHLVLVLFSCSLNLVDTRKSHNTVVKDEIISKIQQNIPKLQDNRVDVVYGYERFSKRKLQEDETAFSKMRFYFETSTFERQIRRSSVPNAEAKGAILMDKVLPSVADKWSSALSVKPANTFLIEDDVVCLLDFPVTNELRTEGLSGYDIVIFVGAYEEVDEVVICGEDEGVLAFASMCSLDQNNRPVVAFINVCLDSIVVQDDGSTLDSDIEYLEDVVLHEIGHGLGLNSEYFRFFINAVTNEPLVNEPFEFEKVECVDQITRDILGAPAANVLQYRNGQGIELSYYELVTPTARQVARNQFACQSVTGARLENQPTNSQDCFGSHFDERLFLTDLMSAYLTGTYFSPMSLAILEDSGHYRANYDITQNSPFGLGAGCDFVNDKCIVDDLVPEYGKGFFCDHYHDRNRWMCDASHHNRGHCDLYKKPNPTTYPYFKNKNLGPYFESADYCPTVREQVHCSNDNGASQVNQFEVFNSDSRCIDYSANGKDSAMCLKATCNEQRRSFDIHVNQDVYSCTYDFQKIRITSYIVKCPRLTAVCPDMFCPSMCSGKGICDWSLPVPICRCFNEMDTTPNCNDSNPTAPDAISLSTDRGEIRLLLLAQIFVFAALK